MVAIYARVSTQEQAQNGYSIGEQVERLKKYCEAMHWEIYKEYVDAGFSGGNMDRPALQNLLLDLRHFDRVVVYKLDRLSRSQKDTLTIIEDIFLKNKISFTSLTESLDTSSPFGMAMIGILAVFAQLEKEQIRERVTLGRIARTKEGKYVGQSRVAIGYQYIDGNLIVNEAEADQVREVFRQVISGKSFKAIARDLKARGLRHHYGEWKAATVRLIARNPIYTGKVAFAGEYYKGLHEPIVDEETFNAAKRIADARTDSLAHQHNPGKATSLLGGMLVCKNCGARYYKRDNLYKCVTRTNGMGCKSPSWHRDELDNLVLNEVRKLTLEREPEVKKDNGLEKQLAKVDTQLAKLLDLYAESDEMSKDVLKYKVDALTDRKRNILAQMEEKPDRNEIISTFRELIERANEEELRAVIGELIDHIEVGETITIVWKL